MSSSELLEVIEQSRLSPLPNSVTDEKKTLPLTFFDLLWVHFHDVQTLYFYRLPESTNSQYFKETIIPSLKHSLSLSLTHFFPLAGNLVFPPNLREPEIQFEDGDSVSVTFAESNADFDYLVKNHPREVSRFHPLIPNLPPPLVKGDSTLAAPVFAVQVTLFPGAGFSLGFTTQHVVADGNSFVRFIKLWASINKQLAQQPSILQEGAVLPSYDRTMVKDPNNIGQMFWEQKQKIIFEGYRPLLPTRNFLGGFVLSEADLQQLKARVKVRFPTLSHVTSFTVSCAYTWSCMIKASARSGEEIISGENELEHLIFPVDCRAHLDPPLPENYFGNCIGACFVTAERKRLIEEDGFEMAANLIAEAIRERLGRKKGAPVGLEELPRIFASINMDRLVGVAGSPKFAVYDIDFGFGRLQKREFISIDETKSMSLHEGKDNKRDIEVSVALSKIKMDALVSLFTNGLVVP